MNYIIVIAILVFALVLKQTVLQKEKQMDTAKRTNPDYYPYEKKMLLTKAEYAFYKILKQKCDEHNLLICPKVRMEDFVSVTDKKQIMKYRGYIKSRHIDFMLCDKNLHIIAGIELDDNSHNSKDAIATDTFKDQVFKTIGIPLHRIKMSMGSYEKQIDAFLNPQNEEPQNTNIS